MMKTWMKAMAVVLVGMMVMGSVFAEGDAAKKAKASKGDKAASKEEQKVKVFKATYLAIDEDKDGNITAEEITDYWTEQGNEKMGKNWAKKVKKMDKNADGKVSVDEYVIFFVPAATAECVEKAECEGVKPLCGKSDKKGKKAAKKAKSEK